MSRDATRPILPPADLFLTSEVFFSHAREFGRISFGEGTVEGFDSLPTLAVERRADDPISRLRRFVDSFVDESNSPEQARVLIVADSAGRRETISQMLAEYRLPFADNADFGAFLTSDARIGVGIAPLHEGFVLHDARLAIVTETELYAASPRRLRGRQRERASNVEAMIRDLAELQVGDPVVHVEHGIGRYLGLQSMQLGDGADAGPTEFLHLEYANETTLYVPVAQLHLIGRYSGADPDAAPLHQLGSGDWDRARRKAAKQVRDTAAELLNLYALRAARKGHAFSFKQHDVEAFAEGFPFEETSDQKAAIEAVLKDMSAGFPMDRLVCGDVGFGKTEVALRAAFAAVADGKQVAVLCPTTLLAEQHMQTFRDRFADWPVQIAELSRFRSSKGSGASGRRHQRRRNRHRDRHA